MTPEEQLLLQQQQKLEGIEQQQRYNLFRSPGQVQGETPQQFAAGKQAANSQAQGYGANPAPVSQPPVQSVAQPVVQQTPARKTQGTVQNKPAITNMDELAAAMGYTSPEQEDKLRKASVANQRILALGDALRHIGNIATTINYAPSQQFNNPVQEEYARYERGKALRDKANQTYLTYQQAKAAQDAKQRQWEMQFRYNAAKDAANLKAQQDYHNATIAERARQADQNLAFNKDKQKATEDRWKRQDAETQRYHKAQTGLGYARLKETKRHNNVIETKTGNGRTGSPYTLPTKEGYLEMARDLNTNQIGKKALFAEMKSAGIIDDVWETRYNNMFSSEAQAALLNTAISQWLMTDEDAPTYMQEHFNAKRYGNSGSTGTMPGVGGGGGSSNTMPGVRN